MSTGAACTGERLQTLTVADVMNRKIVSIPWCATMELAAATLAQSYISGAPVVDDDGRCIGVLTATDLLRFGCSGQDASDRDREWSDIESACDEVTRYMSAVQSVTPQTPLVRAAEIMCAQHIHRLIVLDDRAVPVGIVSTLDIMAALAAATDEARPKREERK
jgi:CBS-domain-containing membrane protein